MLERLDPRRHRAGPARHAARPAAAREARRLRRRCSCSPLVNRRADPGARRRRRDASGGRPCGGSAAVVAAEAALALLVLAVVTAMSVTPPARHEQPAWPLPFRLSFDDADGGARLQEPGARRQPGGGARRRRAAGRRWRCGVACGCRCSPGASCVLVAGLAIAVPPLVSDAYPTTYRRPDGPLPGHVDRRGPGALRRALRRPATAVGGGRRRAGRRRAEAAPARPARAPRRAPHRRRLFWWITHGQPPDAGLRRPARAPTRAGTSINFLRALSAADAARLLGPSVEPDRPWLVAPDFTFGVGPSFSRSLKDYRGRRLVLLVLYTLPTSQRAAGRAGRAPRTSSARSRSRSSRCRPTPAPDALRRLAEGPPILFPVVTDGAPEILDRLPALRAGAPRRVPHRPPGLPARDRRRARTRRATPTGCWPRSRQLNAGEGAAAAARGARALMRAVAGGRAGEPGARPRPRLGLAVVGPAGATAGRASWQVARAAAAGGEREFRATGVVRAGPAASSASSWSPTATSPATCRP